MLGYSTRDAALLIAFQRLLVEAHQCQGERDANGYRLVAPGTPQFDRFVHTCSALVERGWMRAAPEHGTHRYRTTKTGQREFVCWARRTEWAGIRARGETLPEAASWAWYMDRWLEVAS